MSADAYTTPIVEALLRRCRAQRIAEMRPGSDRELYWHAIVPADVRQRIFEEQNQPTPKPTIPDYEI